MKDYKNDSTSDDVLKSREGGSTIDGEMVHENMRFFDCKIAFLNTDNHLYVYFIK